MRPRRTGPQQNGGSTGAFGTDFCPGRRTGRMAGDSPRRRRSSGRPGRSAPRRSTWCGANPDRFRVVGLTAGGSNPELFERRSPSSRRRTPGWARTPRSRRPGWRATWCSTASPARSGCGPTLAALDAGNTLALANKESLIIGGPLVTGRAKPGQIVPVDSEHSALAQCLRGGSAEEVRRLVLTASGGPFRGWSRDELADVTPRAGAGAPDLGDGPGDHDQLGDAGQQGPRGDRGAPALRHPVRPDRGRGAPDQRRALDGRVRRRLDARAGQPADHADPDRARPGLARPGARRRAGGRLDDARDVGVLPARRRGVPGGLAGPGGRASAGAPRRRSTTPPTRCASRRSSPGGCAFTDIVPTVASVVRASHDVPSEEELTVDDVLAADAWARAPRSRHHREGPDDRAATTRSAW